MTASEPGVADLSRLVIQAARESAAPPLVGGADLLPQLSLSVSRYRNSERLVRGLAEPVAAPGASFSAYRQYTPVGFGPRRMESGETLLVEARLLMDPASSGGWSWTFSGLVPFLPDRLRSDCAPRASDERAAMYLASASSPFLGSGDPATLELKADDDGIIDLASLQLMAGLNAQIGFREDLVDSLVITSILLPSGGEVVTGGPKAGAPVLGAPGSAFAANGRPHRWAHLGVVDVSEEDVIRVSVQCRADFGGGAQHLVASVGARFYPAAGSRRRSSDRPRTAHGRMG